MTNLSKLTQKLTILGGILGGVCALSSSAIATEYSSPALSCVENNDRITYPGGDAYNPNGSSDATFRCPMNRRAPDGSSISGIIVTVDDGNDNEDVSCYARSCNAQGGSCANTSSQSSGNSYTGIETLNLGSVDGDTNGYVYIICTVPDDDVSRSGVKSYVWVD